MKIQVVVRSREICYLKTQVAILSRNIRYLKTQVVILSRNIRYLKTQVAILSPNIRYCETAVAILNPNIRYCETAVVPKASLLRRSSCGTGKIERFLRFFSRFLCLSVPSDGFKLDDPEGSPCFRRNDIL